MPRYFKQNPPFFLLSMIPQQAEWCQTNKSVAPADQCASWLIVTALLKSVSHSAVTRRLAGRDGQIFLTAVTSSSGRMSFSASVHRKYYNFFRCLIFRNFTRRTPVVLLPTFQYNPYSMVKQRMTLEMWPIGCPEMAVTYEGWNFNSGNYLFTTDTK